MKTQFPGHRTRANKVRPAERGEEVVKRFLVGEVDQGHASAPPKAIPVKQVVVADCDVEQIPRSYTRRVLVVILRAVCRNAYAFCTSAGRVGPATCRIIAKW